MAFSTPKSIGDGVYVLCQLQLRIAHGGYSIVYRGGLRVQEEPEPRPAVIKQMMLADREDEKMAANEISLLNQLGNHDRIVHLMAAFVEENIRVDGKVWKCVMLVFESCCMTVRDFMLSQGKVSEG